MEEEISNLIKVYVKVNENNCVTDVNSSVFLDSVSDWLEIDEGLGDKYSHAQGNYFDTSLMNEQGIYIYKWTGTEVVKRTDEEIQADIDALPTQKPSETEMLKAQLNAQIERNDFIEDVIAEMAMQVYQ